MSAQPFNGKVFGAQIVEMVKGYVSKALASVTDRLAALENRLDALPVAKDGVGVAHAVIDRSGNLVLTLSDATTRDVGTVVGADGEGATKELIVEALRLAPDLVNAAVAAHFADYPPPAGADGKAGADGRDGSDGKDGADGRDGLDGQNGRDGRDGVDVKDLFRAEGGRLVAVLSDGTVRDLGVFVGKDGEPGKDGRDGFSLDAFDASLADDGRTVLLSFEQGDVKFIAEMPIPAIIDRGVYKAGHEYAQGDAVTWAGSLWIAQERTASKPDSGQGWRLAVKRGRDGKDASK